MLEENKDYEIEFDHSFTATGTGEGFWGCEKGQKLNFYSIYIRITTHDGEWWGSMTLKHNQIKGLAYSDPGVKCDVQAEFMVALGKFSTVIDASSITGSEQGMQEKDALNCDVDCNPFIDDKKLRDLGFKCIDI